MSALVLLHYGAEIQEACCSCVTIEQWPDFFKGHVCGGDCLMDALAWLPSLTVGSRTAERGSC